MQAALLDECPTLELVTTRLDFIELLRIRGRTAPSKIKICIKNAEGKIVSARVIHFVDGGNRNLTTFEIQKDSNQLVSKKKKGVHVREKASVAVEVAFTVRLRGAVRGKAVRSESKCDLSLSFNIVPLINDVELGASGGCVSSNTETSFVAIQARRATATSSTGCCQINKSKKCIVHQVCNSGFMLFGLLYVEDECRGILFLSPEDEALIHSLPDFESFSIGLGKKGIRRQAPAKNSLMEKLSKNLFLWDDANESSIQK
jgi:hypothetical protein